MILSKNAICIFIQALCCDIIRPKRDEKISTDFYVLVCGHRCYARGRGYN